MLNSLIALRLGLPFVPSYLGQPGTVQDMMHGVNYASAGAGVIFTSGSELVCFSVFHFLPILSWRNNRDSQKVICSKRKTQDPDVAISNPICDDIFVGIFMSSSRLGAI